MEKRVRNTLRALTIIAWLSIILNICLTCSIVYLSTHQKEKYEPVMVLPADLPELEPIEELNK